MSKKSWCNLYSNLLYEIGQHFLDSCGRVGDIFNSKYFLIFLWCHFFYSFSRRFTRLNCLFVLSFCESNVELRGVYWLGVGALWFGWGGPAGSPLVFQWKQWKTEQMYCNHWKLTGPQSCRKMPTQPPGRYPVHIPLLVLFEMFPQILPVSLTFLLAFV